MGAGVEVAAVLLGALQAASTSAHGRRSLSGSGRRERSTDDPNVEDDDDEALNATPTTRPRRIAMPCAPWSIAVARSDRRQAAQRVDGKSRARDCALRMPSQPSGGAAACVGVACTGPSTREIERRARAACASSSRVWHEAPTSMSSRTRRRARASAPTVQCTPSQPERARRRLAAVQQHASRRSARASAQELSRERVASRRAASPSRATARAQTLARARARRARGMRSSPRSLAQVMPYTGGSSSAAQHARVRRQQRRDVERAGRLPRERLAVVPAGSPSQSNTRKKLSSTCACG